LFVTSNWQQASDLAEVEIVIDERVDDRPAPESEQATARGRLRRWPHRIRHR